MTTLVSFAAASSALGATIEYRAADKSIDFKAERGELNDLVVDQSAASYTFTDNGTGPAGGVQISADLDDPCTVLANVATCPVANVDSISIRTFGGDDIVVNNAAPPGETIINGGAGHDRLSGGPGRDLIFGGTGADRMLGGSGEDVIDTGFGGYDPDAPLCSGEVLEFPLCVDEAESGADFDTVTYASRPFGVYVDTRIGKGGVAVDDPDPTCMTDPRVVSRPDCEIDLTSGTFRGDYVEQVIGGTGNDELIGNQRDNTLIGGRGADTLCGGLGVDTVDYSDKAAAVTVSLDGNTTYVNPDGTLGMPTDPRNATLDSAVAIKARSDCRTMNTASFAVALPPGPLAPRDCVANDGVANERDCVGEDVENIIGSPFDDTLTGNNPDLLINEGPPIEPRGANRLEGGAGNDLLNGKFGPDLFQGGPGMDTVTYQDRPSPVSATIDGKGNDGAADDPVKGITGDFNPFSGLWDQIEGDVESIIGGASSDTLAGDDDANELRGGSGADRILGGGGDDQLFGENGSDDIRGGDGNDHLDGGANGDTLDGGDGADTLDGGFHEDTLHGGLGADVLNGGTGIDAVDYSDSTRAVSVSLNRLADDGYDLEGDSVALDVEGANGGGANDRLVLGDGDGFLDGGAGDDHLDGGAGADVMNGEAGLDTVDYSARGTAITVDQNAFGGDGESGENDEVGADVEQILGGPAGDSLTGAGGVSILVGNGGADALSGNGGDDQLFGGAGNDALNGGADSDTLDGGEGNDGLTGESGNDTLQGAGGDDALDGGTGKDSEAGGAGTDTAVYSTRTKALALSFDGNSNDGEAGENDVIKLDVENTSSGQGDDAIMSKNGVKNTVSCGRGTDQIVADTFDDIAADCERIMNTTPCKVSPEPATMSKSGVVRIKVSCIEAASGRLSLETAGKVKTSSKRKAKARKVKLGKKSFSVAAAQSKTLKVKISRKGRRVIQRSKRGVTVRGLVTVRQSFGVRALSTKTGDKIKIKAKR